MSTDIEIVQTALTEFDKVAAGLQQLQSNYKGVVYDVACDEGMAMAKASRLVLRAPRYEIERIRKSAKAPLLAIGKKLDAEASRITAEIMKLEDPIHAQIKAEEERIEAEKKARIDAENERIADLHARILDIRNVVVQCAGKSSDDLATAIHELEAVVVDESFQELRQQAQDAKGAALGGLNHLHASAVDREQQAARIAAEREELAKLRADQAERDRIAQKEREQELAEQRSVAKRLAAQRDAELADERTRIADENRAAQQARDAETAKQREEIRRQREELDAQAAQQRRIDAERAAELNTKSLVIAAEQAALEAAKAPKAIPLPSAEGRKPSKEQILRVLADHFGVKEQAVRQWLVHYDWLA